MTKKEKWIYRGLQILFILCILPPTFGKISQNEEFLTSLTGLGYPIYLANILAVAYILGIIAILQTKYQLLKEWAYAGFTFALLGAFLSHVFSNESLKGVFALVALTILLVSYFYGNKIERKIK